MPHLNPKTTITAIISITLLLVIALLKEIDGALLSSGLVIIAGLAGYAAGKARTR